MQINIATVITLLSVAVSVSAVPIAQGSSISARAPPVGSGGGGCSKKQCAAQCRADYHSGLDKRLSCELGECICDEGICNWPYPDGPSGGPTEGGSGGAGPGPTPAQSLANCIRSCQSCPRA